MQIPKIYQNLHNVNISKKFGNISRRFIRNLEAFLDTLTTSIHFGEGLPKSRGMGEIPPHLIMLPSTQ